MFLNKIICESVILQSNVVWTSLSALFQSDSWGRTDLFSDVVWAMSFFKSFPTNQIRTLCGHKGFGFGFYQIILCGLTSHFWGIYLLFLDFIEGFVENQLCKYVMRKCKDSMLKLWSQIKNNLKTPDSEALLNVGPTQLISLGLLLSFMLINHSTILN